MKQKHALTVVGVLLLVVVIVFAMPRLLSESFTKDKWNNATPEMRERLMDGLARSGKLVGLSEEVVVEMLGDPDGTGAFRVHELRVKDHWRRAPMADMLESL